MLIEQFKYLSIIISDSVPELVSGILDKTTQNTTQLIAGYEDKIRKLEEQIKSLDPDMSENDQSRQKNIELSDNIEKIEMSIDAIISSIKSGMRKQNSTIQSVSMELNEL